MGCPGAGMQSVWPLLADDVLGAKPLLGWSIMLLAICAALLTLFALVRHLVMATFDVATLFRHEPTIPQEAALPPPDYEAFRFAGVRFSLQATHEVLLQYQGRWSPGRTSFLKQHLTLTDGWSTKARVLTMIGSFSLAASFM